MKRDRGRTAHRHPDAVACPGALRKAGRWSIRRWSGNAAAGSPGTGWRAARRAAGSIHVWNQARIRLFSAPDGRRPVLPHAAVAEKGVGGHARPAHDGDRGDPVGPAPLPEPLVQMPWDGPPFAFAGDSVQGNDDGSTCSGGEPTDGDPRPVKGEKDV